MRLIQTKLGRVAVGAVLPLAVVAGFISSTSAQAVALPAAPVRAAAPALQPALAPAAEARYTITQVATHSTQSNCWTVIGSGVYNLNLNGFINEHDGGTAVLLPLCGTDGSGMYSNQHGGSNETSGELATLRIGAFDPTPPPVPTATFTIAQVGTHNTPGNCWSAINGTVYNLTAFVAKHAGGTAVITGMCGFDGTASFNGKHAASTPAKNTLALYSVGTLVGGTTTPTPTTVLTQADLAKHAAQASCWSAVNGIVYDLTAFIKTHPGLPGPIIAMCGIDGSASFTAKHGASAGAKSQLLQLPKMGTYAGGTASTTGKTFTLADVALHNKPATDCWVAVAGNVYNVTTWKGGHSGGAAVIDAVCGKDGTATFQGRHGAGAPQFATLAPFLQGTIPGYVVPTPPAAATVAALNRAPADYTMADIALHATAGDCWSAVNGGVYDLTSWVSTHPGGSGTIKAMCGVDGSGSYTAKHSSSATAGAILTKLRIGNVVGARSAAGAATVPEGTTAAATAARTTRAFGRVQVRGHNTANGCWTVVNRNVYNLTPWTKKHRNRTATIKAVCGHNSSKLFNKKYGSAAKANRALKRFLIGSYGRRAAAAPATAPTAAPAGSGLYTAAQVAGHASAADCWSIVSGGVYDLTAWIAQHPGGGSSIKAMCGKESTSSFDSMHSGSATAKAALAKLKIGVIG